MPFSDPKLRCPELTAFEALIEQRLSALREKRSTQAVDAEIWTQYGQRSAVMFTDLAGFSRGVAEFGILHFLQVILESHRLFVPIIEAHNGCLVKVDGDSLLVLYRTPDDALLCAREMLNACQQFNVSRPPEEHVLLCVGIGFGDVLRVGDIDVFGAEVNAAAKLGEDTAKAGEILITENALNALERNLRATCEPIELPTAPPGAARKKRIPGTNASRRSVSCRR
jgi:adenylate cyclase